MQRSPRQPTSPLPHYPGATTPPNRPTSPHSPIRAASPKAGPRPTSRTSSRPGSRQGLYTKTGAGGTPPPRPPSTTGWVTTPTSPGGSPIRGTRRVGKQPAKNYVRVHPRRRLTNAQKKRRSDMNYKEAEEMDLIPIPTYVSWEGNRTLDIARFPDGWTVNTAQDKWIEFEPINTTWGHVFDVRASFDVTSDKEVHTIQTYTYLQYGPPVKQEDEYEAWGAVEPAEPPYKAILGPWIKIITPNRLHEKKMLKLGRKLPSPYNQELSLHNETTETANVFSTLIEQASMYFEEKYELSWRRAAMDKEAEFFFKFELGQLRKALDPTITTLELTPDGRSVRKLRVQEDRQAMKALVTKLEQYTRYISIVDPDYEKEIKGNGGKATDTGDFAWEEFIWNTIWVRIHAEETMKVVGRHLRYLSRKNPDTNNPWTIRMNFQIPSRRIQYNNPDQEQATRRTEEIAARMEEGGPPNTLANRIKRRLDSMPAGRSSSPLERMQEGQFDVRSPDSDPDQSLPSIPAGGGGGTRKLSQRLIENRPLSPIIPPARPIAAGGGYPPRGGGGGGLPPRRRGAPGNDPDDSDTSLDAAYVIDPQRRGRRAGTTPLQDNEWLFPPPPPQDPLAVAPRGPTIDQKFKISDLPAWDGKDRTLIDWIFQVNDMAELGYDVFRGLGRNLPRRFTDMATNWWQGMTPARKVAIGQDWGTLRMAIGMQWMTNRFRTNEKLRTKKITFRSEGHTKETPMEYYYRKLRAMRVSFPGLLEEDITAEIKDCSPDSWQKYYTERTDTLLQLCSQIQANQHLFRAEAETTTQLGHLADEVAKLKKGGGTNYSTKATVATSNKPFYHKKAQTNVVDSKKPIGSHPDIPTTPPYAKRDDVKTKKGDSPKTKGARPCRHCGSGNHWDNECPHSTSRKAVRVHMASADPELLEAFDEYEALQLSGSEKEEVPKESAQEESSGNDSSSD